MLQLTDAATVQMAAVRPSCPAWCSHHTDGGAGAPEVHCAHLGPIGGVQIHLFRTSDGPLNASVLDENRFALIDIMDAAALRPLAELFNAAADVAASEAGRHRRS